jgi:hypothetical protein
MLSFSSHWTFVFFFCFFLVASLKFSSLLLADRIVDVIDYLFRCFGISFVVCFFFFFFFFLVAFFKFASVIPIESPTVINCHFLSYFLLTRTRCSFFFFGRVPRIFLASALSGGNLSFPPQNLSLYRFYLQVFLFHSHPPGFLTIAGSIDAARRRSRIQNQNMQSMSKRH